MPMTTTDTRVELRRATKRYLIGSTEVMALDRAMSAPPGWASATQTPPPTAIAATWRSASRAPGSTSPGTRSSPRCESLEVVEFGRSTLG